MVKWEEVEDRFIKAHLGYAPSDKSHHSTSVTRAMSQEIADLYQRKSELMETIIDYQSQHNTARRHIEDLQDVNSEQRVKDLEAKLKAASYECEQLDKMVTKRSNRIKELEDRLDKNQGVLEDAHQFFEETGLGILADRLREVVEEQWKDERKQWKDEDERANQ